MSEAPPTCPHCSAPLAPTAAQGALCPRCLLAQGMARSDSRLGSDGEPRTPPPPPPEIAELAPLFPELELLELLGQGGMGSVYKARQRALGRLVALKILTPRPGDEAGFAARFEREAHALARLAHGNVVGIHDSGRTQGRCWLLMEYVEGVNLRQLLRAGELTVPRALAIVRQICDALEFAHEQGIVHRDIKPENVLVDTRGRVKIADFGLAKIVGEEPSGEPITRTQQSMGTPQYMAPEQLTGSKSVDHRADIYSLGVVFYELLTGELPLGRFEPPSQRVEVDVRLDEVVLRALERAPERRYQHATEMKTGIEKLDEPAPAAPQVAGPEDPPGIFWLLPLLIAPLVLHLSLTGLGIAGAEGERIRSASAAACLLGLGALAWWWRKHRRGALLRYGLALSAAGVAVLGFVRASSVAADLETRLELDPRPVDAWIVRLLLAVFLFEGLRIAWSARQQLVARLAWRPNAWRVDLVLLAGVTLLVLVCGSSPWSQLCRAQFEVPLLVFLLGMAEGLAAARPVIGPEPRQWLRERIEARRDVEEPAEVPRTRWVRGILLPVLVAISAWVMSVYTSHWGWYGALASSLVLALAVAGYLQQSIAPVVLEELRKEPVALRALRAGSALLVLSIGTIGIGAAAFGVAPRESDLPQDPSGDRLLHLAQLVAASAREGNDPLRELPARIQGAKLSWDRTGLVLPRRIEASGPDGWNAALLVFLAPALLVGTRRFYNSWGGGYRHSVETLLIVLAGWAGSRPVCALLHVRITQPKPLVLEASFPFSLQHASEALRAALEQEGGRVSASESRLYSDRDSGVLFYEALRARGPGGIDLECELAGDAGHWGSGVRLDAGDVPERSRAAVREALTRVLQATRSR